MIVQNPSVLLADGAPELLDRPLADYAPFLRFKGPLRPAHLKAVDYALRHQVVRLLVRRAAAEELEEAFDTLRRLVPIRRQEELAPWTARWRGFADLLQARLFVLDALEPERAANYAHADRILGLVKQQPGLTQAEIAGKLDLKPANLSRILAILEASELIERRSVDRRKLVFLGAQASVATEDLPDRSEATREVAEATPVYDRPVQAKADAKAKARVQVEPSMRPPIYRRMKRHSSIFGRAA